ncbi:MAG: ISKra4 family transposase [Chloroflexota bacterium]
MLAGRLVVEPDHDEAEVEINEILYLERNTSTIETIGLTLAEGKEILAQIQQKVVAHQAAEFIEQHRHCKHCQKPLRLNGSQTIKYRILFGKLDVKGERFYHCRCKTSATKTYNPLSQLFSEKTSPELSYLQSKWSSLMSYGLTVKMLEEVLPISVSLASLHRQTQAVAQRIEDDLGEEVTMYIDGPARKWAALPIPNERLFVGIDGGFVRGREKDNRKAGWFEVIVGKSLLKNQPSKRFTFVQTYDEKPKRRLFETLQSHGMQMNQEITFLSDGGDDVRELQSYLNPNSEHILDWFHVTMKITAMNQITKGIGDDDFKEKMLKKLERVKWRLWHGHVLNALSDLELMLEDCEIEEAEDSRRDQLLKALDEYRTYIFNN